VTTISCPIDGVLNWPGPERSSPGVDPVGRKAFSHLYLSPTIWAALTEEERGELLNHEEFLATIRESGELVSDHAIADPSTSAVVRVRDGVAAVTDGPYLEAKEYLAG
jgi:hypothetical protein